jgi:putative ATP-dependent endonuclease of the OLD family
MRLARVTVTNYRSILAAESFDVGDYTVLVGPNNEGKSNLLRAIVLALETIHRWANLKVAAGTSISYAALRQASTPLTAGMTNFDRRSRIDSTYSWERDFPMTKRTRVTAASASRIRLEFELDSSEKEDFRSKVGSYNNGRLPVEISFGPSTVGLTIVKQGPGSKALSLKSQEIAKAVASNLQIFSIPTARTETNVLGVIQSLVSLQLSKLNFTKEYKEAADQLQILREQAILQLEGSMKITLGEYLTGLVGVEILGGSIAEQSLRVEDLIIDDGVATSISEKGDGIKSLAAISLMQEAARNMTLSARLIAAIDEPEAHLHPDAIHKLKTKLLDIAKTQQVIVSTHSSVLVNRGSVGSNVIVAENRARAASSLVEVRKTLGVRLADNLSHAEVVILVEGTSDEEAFRAILSDRSKMLSRAISSGEIAFIAIRGVKRLHTELLSQRNAVCRPFLILDDDAPARDAVAAEIGAGILTAAEYVHLHRPGGDSELEDLFKASITIDAVRDMFSVGISEAQMKVRKPKWSAKVEGLLRAAGKAPTDELMNELKAKIAGAVGRSPKDAIDPDRDALIDAIVVQIEEMFTASTS